MNNPKVILSAITLAFAIPITGITLTLINPGGAVPIAAANPASSGSITPQTSASAPTATQQAPNDVGGSDAVTPDPPTPLPDPLTPETNPNPTMPPAAPTATPDATSAAAPQQETNVTKSPSPRTATTPAPRKIQPHIQGEWVAPVIAVPGEVTLTTPTLTSGAKVSTTIACSPSANCALEGATLMMVADTQVSITYSAKGTKKFTAWSHTVTN